MTVELLNVAKDQNLKNIFQMKKLIIRLLTIIIKHLCQNQQILMNI